MNLMGYMQRIQRKLGSYWDVAPLSVLGGLDVEYKPVLGAVEFRVAGTFSFVNIYDQTREIEVDTGRIYPIHVKKVNSADTDMTEDQIYGYKEYFD